MILQMHCGVTSGTALVFSVIWVPGVVNRESP